MSKLSFLNHYRLSCYISPTFDTQMVWGTRRLLKPLEMTAHHTFGAPYHVHNDRSGRSQFRTRDGLTLGDYYPIEPQLMRMGLLDEKTMGNKEREARRKSRGKGRPKKGAGAKKTKKA
eukprot:TRINITY_DN1802_c0_g1_i1.p1 TRINITY_DN1802_c0_g1~~TRINITY_DN1802_c0_g1_i1.p1  ORF type:complete len:128 (+),score=23.76 TRINITY_DN1802_c0_g1_i1:33-386(+)